MLSCLKKIMVRRQGLLLNSNYGLAAPKNLDYQKALLASETIRLIMSDKDVDLHNCSLKDKIIKTINENQSV